MDRRKSIEYVQGGLKMKGRKEALKTLIKLGEKQIEVYEKLIKSYKRELKELKKKGD